MTGNYDKLVSVILERYCGERLIIGVDGLSRAGKTTVVSLLQQGIIETGKDVCVFHIDDHIVERKKRYDTGFSQWQEYYNFQWDVGYLRQNLFGKLRDALEIDLPFYDSERDEITMRMVVIPSDCIVIMEGVFLQREEWRQFFDFVVYLDCKRETRFQSESARTREQIEKFKTRYWKAEDHYLETVSPLSNADMIISS